MKTKTLKEGFWWGCGERHTQGRREGEGEGEKISREKGRV